MSEASLPPALSTFSSSSSFFSFFPPHHLPLNPPSLRPRASPTPPPRCPSQSAHRLPRAAPVVILLLFLIWFFFWGGGFRDRLKADRAHGDAGCSVTMASPGQQEWRQDRGIRIRACVCVCVFRCVCVCVFRCVCVCVCVWA